MSWRINIAVSSATGLFEIASRQGASASVSAVAKNLAHFSGNGIATHSYGFMPHPVAKFPFRFKASKSPTSQAACLSTVDSAVASGDHFPKRRDKDYHDQNLDHEEAMLHSSSQKSFCKTLMMPFVAAVALWLNPGTAQAGPCTADISQFEATVQQSASDPFAGLMARQSVDAQLGHQPTPESVHNSDQRVKSRFDAAMARAKRFDAQGNRPGCTRALNAAKKIYIR